MENLWVFENKRNLRLITSPRRDPSGVWDLGFERPLWVVTLMLLLSSLAHAQFSPSASLPPLQQVEPGTQIAPDSSLYVKVRLSTATKMSALKPGDVVEGELSRDVFSGQRELFPAGSPVHLTVDKLERRKRVRNDHWPWVINAFKPRYEKYPTFRCASVSSSDGEEIDLRVSLISVGNRKSVHAQAKKNTKKLAKEAANPANQVQEMNATPPAAIPESTSKQGAIGMTVALEAELTANQPVASSGADSAGLASPATPVILAAGTQAKIILLREVSASRSRPGDSFQARIVQPVWLGNKMIVPEGAWLEGKVVKASPPRMLSRAGSLLLAFTRLTMPDGAVTPVIASVSAAELDQRSHTRIDPEGKLIGERPGKAWMLINMGVTAGIAKEVDDGVQLLIEAIVSTATDASTAGIARIVATCASAVFILTRHGRDVVLPKFTEMNVMFNRPVVLFDSKPGGRSALYHR